MKQSNWVENGEVTVSVFLVFFDINKNSLTCTEVLASACFRVCGVEGGER